MQINVNCRNSKKTTWLKQTGLALAALSLSINAVYAAATFDQPDSHFNGTVNAMGVHYAGDQVNINGRAFTPGQEVILLQNGHVLTEKALKADDKGNFSTTITLPADAKSGQHAIVVQAAEPSTAAVFKLKVSTKFPQSGQDKFDITTESLVPGVYQSAYSPKSNAIFVTSAVGRPPVRESQLLKVDPNTLKITASAKPAAQQDRDDGQVQAVYGVGVDDEHGTVWVTNTRSNTVAVYKQADLSLVKQFENGAAPHARDVVIDSNKQRAYVSTPGAPTVAVFDTKTLKALPAIELLSAGYERPSPLSLALDAEGGKLYTVSMNTNELFAVDLNKNETAVFALPGALSASGVAIDAKRGHAYVASQGSDNILIVDTKQGKVLHDIEIGAGALNVVFDPTTDVAYAVSRGAGTLTVIQPDGNILANLNLGSMPNHVSLDGQGNVYAVTKAQGKDDSLGGDRISRIQLKK